MKPKIAMGIIVLIAVVGIGFSVSCDLVGDNSYNCVLDNGESYVCSSIAHDLTGCCNGRIDVVPEGRIFDASACDGTTQDLHIGNIIYSPSCSFSTRVRSIVFNSYIPTDDPERGSAYCLPGYLDCISGNVSSNMGCETNCNECENDRDCSSWGDFEPKCDKTTHCNKCTLVGKNGKVVLFESNGELNDETYHFILYNIVSNSGTKSYVDIYDSDGLVVESKLENGDYFSIGDNMYRVSFSTYNDLYIHIYKVNFVTRLTYNIFPVCGNQVCETCESSDNCLHYPPESCFSCPLDCPVVDDNELAAYFEQFGDHYSIVDVENDVDLACKVKTLDNNAVCDPLCRVHPYIDKNGCLFNKYGNSYPVNEDGVIIGSENLHTTKFSFNGKTLTGVYDDEGNFLGEESSYPNHLYTSSGNGECLADCECLSGHCSKNNPNEVGNKEYGHCCPPGFEWEDTDPRADLCEDGRLKNRDAYLVDDDHNGISDITEDSNKRGVEITSIVCPNGYTGGSCLYGIDPACAYAYPDGTYAKIEPDGVFQCRKVENTVPSVVADMRCLVHSHAAAYGECQEKHWYCTDGCCDDEWTKGSAAKCSTFRRMYCVTDRNNECADIEDFREWAFNTKPVMFSITYREFCTTPEYVCAKPSFVDSDGRGGGFINFFGCPEGSMEDSCSNSDNWLPPMPMSIGQYCSLFGNDIGHIFNYSSKYHLPMIDYDSIEEYYREMWNYETCKDIFGEEVVPDCKNRFEGELTFYDYVYTTSGIDSASHSYDEINLDYSYFVPLDENGEPSSLVYTSFDDFIMYSSDTLPGSNPKTKYYYTHNPYKEAYSKEWCEGFWNAFEEQVGEEFNYTAFEDSLSCVGKECKWNFPLKDRPELVNKEFSINYDGKNIKFYQAYYPGVSLVPKYRFSAAVYSCLFYASSYREAYYSGGTPKQFVYRYENDNLISCHPDECNQDTGLLKFGYR